ncbi:hypothetical protein J5N58_03470 [Rhizobium cremeum]|uniref:hypothetical protein n=1 Tax=Rhizobium cremeum TaxID=2813827 RepID=UPI001FD2FDA0|nr:hypothetical protein [Rhizobium cremeum]MCJ7993670.1 hypothetical protein [Rhizobium cremeum]MCJ7998727.1 hypothetical protein [Rhizobium cremeum]
MTAEIAILNKLAVALATDSAVTITAGDEEQKIYDSADKLFDLSFRNPIGIMIYNGMQFMQAPLQTLISEYRNTCRSFDTVREAADDFLKYLNDWGAHSPSYVIRSALEAILIPLLEQIRARIQKKHRELFETEDYTDLQKKLESIPGDVLDVVDTVLARANPSSFVGGEAPEITGERSAVIKNIIVENWPSDDSQFIGRLTTIATKVLLLDVGSPAHTGIVIAGFGNIEKFPTLVSFTIDGVVFDKLKFTETNFVDIDRNGDRARVIPFAQKEMVERFLYGLDSEIERQITIWCKEAVPEIRNQILNSLDMTPEDRNSLTQEAQDAEDAFIDDLKNKRFEEIRTSSRTAIEGMVEFMPKPELARMAEALVNLTSIKRRVSRGMETVGGPIDVAVISRTEGFIWVKRKHYFSTDLNPRYVSRISVKATRNEDG